MPSLRLNRRTITVFVLLAISVFALVYSLTYPIGDLNEPGPGMWPTFGSAVMLVCSITLLFTTSDTLEEYQEYSKRGLRDVLLVLTAAGIWIVVVGFTGLIIPTFGFLMAWLMVIGKESWKLSVGVAAVSAIAIYLLFDVMLRIPFPRDVLASLIGL